MTLLNEGLEMGEDLFNTTDEFFGVELHIQQDISDEKQSLQNIMHSLAFEMNQCLCTHQ
jgi:hypothetical protein